MICLLLRGASGPPIFTLRACLTYQLLPPLLQLRAVAEQWAAEMFTFAEHKQRGPVILKPSDTTELMERLEDSLMLLGSMATNRYSAPFRTQVDFDVVLGFGRGMGVGWVEWVKSSGTCIGGAPWSGWR